MTLTDGILKIIGTAAAAAPVTVPSGTTHFIFTGASAGTVTTTVTVGAHLITVQCGVPIPLHDVANLPAISNANSATFTNVAFVKVVRRQP